MKKVMTIAYSLVIFLELILISCSNDMTPKKVNKIFWNGRCQNLQVKKS